MRQRYINGETQNSIAKAFKLSAGYVGHIVTGRVWNHLPLVSPRKKAGRTSLLGAEKETL